MTKKMIIPSGMIKFPEGDDLMSETRPARLVDLPTSIRGFCFHDDDGEEIIVLNSRLTWEQNRITYDHERGHLDRGELDDSDYHEYGA